MGGFSLWHWLIVLVIVVLVFGTKRLKNVGKDLGEAMRGFKKGLNEDPGAADKADESKDDDDRNPPVVRSEEHTSELQSLMRIAYAVICLKKKKQQHINNKLKDSM